MIMFKIRELLEATAGLLLSGRKEAEVKGISIDSRTTKLGDLFIAIKGSHFDGHDFIQEAIRKKAAALIVEKRLDIRSDIPLILVKDTIRSLGDIAHFYRKRFSAAVIGITGSNGKTTAKDMAAFLLGTKFRVLKNEGTQNNQIGLPLTLLKLNNSHNLVVLELGTNHFGEIAYLSKIAQANMGAILNIGPSHLEFFHNLSGVFKEKYDLIRSLISPYIGILNSDDRFLNLAIKKTKDRLIIGFGIKNKCEFRARDIRLDKDGLRFKLNKYEIRLNTLGPFNVYNALSAIAIARIFGIDYPDIILRLKRFRFPQGRLQIKRIRKAMFIDDTYNSTPPSLNQALNVLKNIKTKGKKIMIMGDMLELGGYSKKFHQQAGEQISQICDIIISVGALAKVASLTALKKGFDRNSIFSCESIKEAKDILFNIIKPASGDIVLVKGSRLMRMEEILKSC